jgi:molybdate transport system substrate-binding protein
MFLMSVLTGCSVNKETPKARVAPVNLTISAAASLMNAMEELKTIFTSQRPNVNITYNFAASGTLQKQIEEGAPVDLFISAGESQMDALAEKGLIVDATRKDLLGNELVLIVKSGGTITGFEGLTDQGIAKISIGTPETVPAGKYAKDALISMQLWDKLQAKMVLAKDVRQVLTYVETGNVDAGLVYRSDAMAGRDVRVVAAAPPESHKPIVYPMAVIKNTRHAKEAEAFAAFLSSGEAAGIFIKHGFRPLNKMEPR